MNKFFMNIRSTNMTVQEWSGPFSSMTFKDVKKLNFAFKKNRLKLTILASDII